MLREIFFVLGCQRSGTTLMRLILDSHSQIMCFDEQRSYDILRNYDIFVSNNDVDDQVKLFGFKTLGYTEQMDRSFLSEPVKNTTIPNNWKDSKIIFLYRNVFDVISSMKHYIQKNGKSWLENWVMPTIDFWKQKIPNFELDFEKEIKYAANTKNKLISYAAIYWKFKTQSMLKYQNNYLSIIKVKYEDLVTNPQIELEKLIKFFNIAWEDSLLNHYRIKHDEVNNDGFTVGMNLATIPIHKNSIGRCGTTLSQQEKNDVFYITKELLAELDFRYQ